MSNFTFKWPKGPQEVILTGSFDNWSKSLYLVKQADGSFSLTVPLPKETDKVLYKYVVDGEWVVSRDERITADDAGIENNYLEGSDLVDASSTGAAIPEAGGLPAAIKGNDVKTTVMPQVEQKQTTMGEPGIFVPKDPEALAAFETVRNVDPKTLNEPEPEVSAAEPELTAAEKKKQKKKVKRSQYKKKKKAAKAGAVTTEESTEESPEPETKATEPVAVESAAVVKGGDIPVTDVPIEQVPVKDIESKDTQPFEEAIDETQAKNTEVVPVEEPVESKQAEPVDTSAAVAAATAVPVAGVTAAGASEPVESVEPVEAEPIPEPVVEPVKEPAADPLAPVEPVEPIAETVVPVPAEATETKDGYHSLDPNADGKEVQAEPVNDEEEIIVAQGNGKDIEAQILANENGDVTVEEIQPTESERAKFTEEAIGSPTSATKATPTKTTKKETKKEEPKKEKKEKKKGFFSKLKKIFN